MFQANEYEDDEPLNSTWAEGDWNGDGEFGSSDLIVAFQAGYDEPPPAAAKARVGRSDAAFALHADTTFVTETSLRSFESPNDTNPPPPPNHERHPEVQIDPEFGPRIAAWRHSTDQLFAKLNESDDEFGFDSSNL